MAKDVNIENGTIVASRFMLQAKELPPTQPPTDLVRKVREIVDKYPYKIAIYHPYFIYSDLVNFPLYLSLLFLKFQPSEGKTVCGYYWNFGTLQ